MSKIWIRAKLQKLAMKKKNAFVTRSITLPRIDKDTLLERAAANSGIRKGVIYSATDAITNEIENFLLNGHSVELPLLGSFRFGVKAKATDEEPDSAVEQVYRRRIIYKPSKAIWRKLQSVNLIDVTEKAEDDDSEDEDEG